MDDAEWEARRAERFDAARDELYAWARWHARRDEIVVEAYVSGVEKAEIARVTGIARTTVYRILARH
jgi:DNA-directed RNA polymerase specialized sigma24 family protein